MILMVFSILVLSRGSIGDAQENENLYSIQLGAFREHGYAVDLVNSLKRLGHDAFERKERHGDNKVIHRVYIEKFKSRRAADLEAKSLKDLGLISEYAIKGLGKPGQVKNRRESSMVYYLHVGSYKQKDNAKKKVRMLERHDCRAVVVEEEISGETWFRIYIGEFKDEEEARSFGSKLRDKVVISYFKPIPINKKALSSRKDSRTSQ
jgi:cell division septation protein DedD